MQHSREHKNRRGSNLALIGRPLIGCVLIFVLLWLVPIRKIGAILIQTRPGPFCLAVLIAISGLLVSSLKLQVLLRTSVPGMSLRTVVRAYCVGTFFSNFLPSSVGGDVMKIRELSDDQGPTGHLVASVVMERCSGLGIVLLIGLVVAVAWGQLFVRLNLHMLRVPLVLTVTGFLVALPGLHILWKRGSEDFFRSRKETVICGGIYRTISSFYAFADHPRTMFMVTVLSAIFYVLVAMQSFVLVYAVRDVISPMEAVGILPLRVLPELLPISVGGLGVREGAFSYCLMGLGVSASQAVAAAILGRLITWLYSLIGGGLFVLKGRATSSHTAATSDRVE